MKKPGRSFPFAFGAACVFLLLHLAAPSSSICAEKETSNKAAKIRLIEATFGTEAAGAKVSAGEIFLVLQTEWENILPKQKIEKSRLEGKTDRTMGVGGLRGGNKTKKEEYVDVDVAYLIKKFYDHAYVLADGLAFPLHPAAEKIQGGIKIFAPFSLPKLGDKKEVVLLYSVPEMAENLAFQFFDYKYGHILLPIKGDMTKAWGTGAPPGKILGQAKSKLIELAARSLSFRQDYAGKTAPQGWRYAVIELSGKSLSGKNIMDIVQLKPDEAAWVTSDGGYLYYGVAGSGPLDRFLRFTPEVYMLQDVAFLVPENAASFRLGLRVKNEVFHIDLKGRPQSIPEAKEKHTDGNVMEVFLFGTRKDNGNIILDLGIKSLSDRRGLEIQTKNQFILLAGEKKVYFDRKATESLPHKPPKKFIVPPGETVRFELAFVTAVAPTQLYFRGYKSQAKLPISE